MADVILHAFNWRYRDVTEQAPAIAAAGYGGVLFPPPLYSDERVPEWWQRYQPKDYRVLRSHLGDKAELEAAVAALHRHGVRALADVVFNHMANEKGSRPDPYSFPGERELLRYRAERESFERDRLYGNLDDGLFCSWDFNPQGDIKDWMDLHEANEHWLGGLPDLDLNPWVLEQQRTCLRELNRLGFDGYRIDAIKHLPDEHIRSVFETDDMAGKYVFGEALTTNDHEETVFLWPLVEQTRLAFYDFPLHETLRRAFAPGGSLRELVDPAALGQALPWHRALTFSVTHDIPYNDGFRGQLLERQDEYLVNAYLFGRDGGVPMVFSDHGESAADDGRWCEAWKRYDVVQMIAFHNAVHGLGQRPLWEDDGFLVLARGDRGIVAVNKTGEWQHPRVATGGLRPGRYRCQLHQHEMTIAGDPFAFAIPPRQAQLWLREG